ncbi:MAG: DUF3786 domain-containing protein [Candidatus Adiutrix sp.]|jgi:hypothetical protein|nr:DUF3786 domain-containing protein [Candidatus Adiutrix sp.]
MNTLISKAFQHDRQEFTLPDCAYDHLWAELAAKDEAEVARLALARAVEPGRYAVEMMGAEYTLDVCNRSVSGPVNRIAPDKRTVLCLAHYLNGAADVALTNNMVSEKVLPGGDRFFSGGHALKRQAILGKFAASGPEFIKAAESLGGEALASGPDSFSFKIKLLPKIVGQLVLGEEDDEFPAQLSFAFDDSAVKHVSLGVLASLIAILNDQMVA